MADMPDKKHKRRKSKKEGKKSDDVELYKHYETFYEAAPPGLVRVEKEKPEDCIPDLPENEGAREFLAKAPGKGLWMPLGKEVKVMKCWRCKRYGHRTGDKECPLFTSGNQTIEKFRMAHEDPMHDFIAEKKKTEKEQRIEQLKALLDEPTTSESETSDSTSSSGSRSGHKKHKKGKRKHHKSRNKSKKSEKQTNYDRHTKKLYRSNKRKHRDTHDEKSRVRKHSDHKSKKRKNHISSSSSD